MQRVATGYLQWPSRQMPGSHQTWLRRFESKGVDLLALKKCGVVEVCLWPSVV